MCALHIYKASAGSGKTYTLVKEFITLLFAGDNMHRRILAVTFTHKATNEMKERVITQLHLLATGQPSSYRAVLMERYGLSEESVNAKAKKILTNLLQDYSSFSISTIDSFFQKIIRTFARELKLSGSYTVGLDTDLLLEQVVDNMFLSLHKDSSLFDWLLSFSVSKIMEGKDWNVRKEILDLSKQLFNERYQSNQQETPQMRDVEALKASLVRIRDDFKRILAEKAVAIQKLLRQNQIDYTEFKNSTRSPMLKVKKWAEGDVVEFPDSLVPYIEAAENCYTKSSCKKKGEINACHASLSKLLQEIKELFEQQYEHYLTAETVLRHLSTLGVLTSVESQIEQLSKEQNVLPISNTNQLLQGLIDDSDAPFIYERTGTHYWHYMLDEFQDTSRLQWHNFRPLIAESIANQHQNLIVGDVKQSIYRWRNSDWTLLNRQIDRDIPNNKAFELNVNRRSLPEIIRFNNEFFLKAVGVLTDELRAKDADVASELQDAYATVKQDIDPGKSGGYVEFSACDKETFPSWVEEQVLIRIRQLEEKQADLSHVAILVRTNKEAAEMATLLLNNNYKVLTSEALSVSNASTVRFLVALISHLVKPDDVIMTAVVNYNYCLFNGKDESEAFLALSRGGKLLLTSEEQQQLAGLSRLPFFEMVERMIALFQLNKVPGQRVFWETFLDMVRQYTIDNGSDMNGFLDWWEQKGQSKPIDTPLVDNAIQIITIHKAKGLEFDYVILPFCDWKLNGDSRNILWCSLDNAENLPDNKIHVVPLSYTKSLGNTVFKEDYREELRNSYIDNLNLLYVAFTRAVRELYLFAPDAADKKSLTTVGDLLCACLKDNMVGNEDVFYSYSIGQSAVVPVASSATEQQQTVELPFVSHPSSVTLSKHHGFVPMTSHDLSQDKQRLGVVMHALLCEVKKEQDFPHVLRAFVADGVIAQCDVEVLTDEWKKFKELIAGYDWFTSPDYEIRNEASILRPSGSVKRPDRIMLNAITKDAIVVDYKFGMHESEDYSAQVAEYKDLIGQMGYSCKAYLCYVALGKIIQV